MTRSSVTSSSNKAGVDRRAVLKGATSFAAIAASATTVGFAFDAKALSAVANPFAGPVNTGPSSVTTAAIGNIAAAPGTPYIMPTAPGWSVTSIFTTGNEIGGYRMAGLPDGMGAFANGDRTITVLIAHEIGSGKGPARGHGGKGAFVSRWTINKDTLDVLKGEDFVSSPAKFNLWVDGAYKAGDAAMGKALDITRLCSADLAPVSAFYNAASKKGYDGRLFLTGEEAGLNANRAFAFVVADGSAYELPAFGFGKPDDKADPSPSWENLVANPSTGDQTVVMAMSDGGSYMTYVYVGTKQADGSPVQKAGLTNGKLYSFAVEGAAKEDRDTNVGIVKSLVGKGAGKRLGLAAPNKGTSFLRPEDGAWDPRNPNVFYFVTTDRNNLAADGTARDGQDVTQVGRTRLWAVTFDDVNKIATDGKPTAKLELLLDGTEGGDMFDNITIDKQGVIYLCEDIGNSRHNGKIWSYDTGTGAFTMITKFDPAKFGDVVDKKYTPPTAPFVDDKETSGIIDVTDLFADAAWYKAGAKVLLVVAQAHFKYDENDKIGGNLVEGGQLLLLTKAA